MTITEAQEALREQIDLLQAMVEDENCYFMEGELEAYVKLLQEKVAAYIALTKPEVMQ